MKNLGKEALVCIFTMSWILWTAVLPTQAQGDSHPRILVKDGQKDAWQSTLQRTPWKQAYIANLEKKLAPYLAYCQEDSTWLLSRLQMNWNTKHQKVFVKGGKFSHSEGQAPVPTVRFSGSRDWATDYRSLPLEQIVPFQDDERGIRLKHKKSGKTEWVLPNESGNIIEGINNQILLLAQDAAFLYWLTGRQEYAELALPVFSTYMQGMYHREAPIDLLKTHQQEIIGLATFEVIHEKSVVPLALIYDFLYDQLSHDHKALSTAVFQKWGNQIIKNGVADNNWNLFQAHFLMYIALVLDDNQHYPNGQGRQYFLDHIFNISTERQLAIRESLGVYDQQTGIWPESPGYSLHVTASLLRILTLLEHFTGENELENYPIIEKSVWASFQYLFPSGHTVGFGDTGHSRIPSETFELLLTNYLRNGQTQKADQITQQLSAAIHEGAYQRQAHSLFELFFYSDDLQKAEPNTTPTLLTTPTFYAPNVSLFIQRLGQDKNALMASLVGSYGNHAHANGIALEFFANGYVMGPDMGKGPSYWHPDHRDYYAQFPAHNTVVVDGKSSHASMRGHHPFSLDAHYPIAGAPAPAFDKVTYARTSFVEPRTLAQQQRLTALVATAGGPGYMLDIFRSHIPGASQQRHDYFYHNIGSSISLYGSNNSPLKSQPTTDLGSHQGDLKAYDYLTNKTLLSTDQDLRAVFQVPVGGQADHQMQLWIKGQDQQTIYTALAPPSNALNSRTAPSAIVDQDIPTLIIQKKAAAWNNPFAVIYNPRIADQPNPIEKVVFDSLSPTIKVFTAGDMLDIITPLEGKNEVKLDDDFYQKGGLSIVRSQRSQHKPEFIFLSEMYQFNTQGWRMEALGLPFTASIEKTLEGYKVITDRPMLLGVPVSEHVTAELTTYQDGKPGQPLQGTPSRQHKNLLEFRISGAIDSATLVFGEP